MTSELILILDETNPEWNLVGQKCNRLILKGDYFCPSEMSKVINQLDLSETTEIDLPYYKFQDYEMDMWDPLILFILDKSAATTEQEKVEFKLTKIKSSMSIGMALLLEKMGIQVEALCLPVTKHDIHVSNLLFSEFKRSKICFRCPDSMGSLFGKHHNILTGMVTYNVLDYVFYICFRQPYCSTFR